MSWNGNPSDINQTFVIGLPNGGGPMLSACTGVLTNFIQSCDGDVSLILTGNTAIFSGDTYFLGSISATTISGDTFFSGGTSLMQIIQDALIQSQFTGNTSGTCINDFYVTNLYGCPEITLHDDIVPSVDNTVNLGTPIKRFRSINTVSGTTTIWKVTQSLEVPSISACTEVVTNALISCSGDSQILLTSGETLFNTNVMPFLTDTIILGGPIKRFRDVNTLSGTSTVWFSTISITTPKLDLGLDSLGNPRVITANSSVIQSDILDNGSY